ncbi:uncharacterized protein teq isoform X4 [Drosophila pseudoobscura]|uniref:Uncharacterized protein teq isoform X4 n=1 Tax=Drosophila pseudoobscura pseudoobscura TaxID=46245 RepID=A0A6I8WAK0_DROPS|nr:uncharacterized protein LOC6900929 isoform X4 [Drosophila pseudoobscura]
MAKWLLGLWLLLLVVNGHEANAYHSGGYRTSGSNQAEQAGLSAGHSAYGSSGNIQEQPIYERPSEGGVGGGACPPQFSGVVSYPYDCHRYVNCHNGSPTIQTCAPGTLFNARTLVCDHPSNVACATPAGGAQAAEPNRSARLREVDTEPRCTPGVIGLQPHPTDCTKFLNCANGKAFVQDCGPGTAFSPSALVCVHKSTVDCGAEAAGQGFSQVSSEVPRCPPGLRGLHQHHRDPYKYLVCGIGVQARVEQCPPGQNFDAHRLVCVFSASSSSQSSSSTFNSSELHVSDILCPTGANGLFVHPFDQTKFLNCKDGKVAVQGCQSGNVFSISKGYCHLKSQLILNDYVTYTISEISYEFSLILTACPNGLEGLHLYPYDAGKYVRCFASGQMSILECGPQNAFSLSQRDCRPRRQVRSGDRVRFWEEIEVQTTTTVSYLDSHGPTVLSSLRSCPLNLQGNYPYPFHAGHFVKCQNGLLQVECCPSGFVFSLSKRACAARHLLSAHEYLDYSYLSVEFSTEFMHDFTAVACPPQSRGYYLHPFDCTKYLKCLDQQTAIESCQQGLVFSISLQRCVSKDQLAANYDSVEYLWEAQHEPSEDGAGRQSYGKNLNVNGYASCPPGAFGLQVHPFDCTKFLNCANGQTFVESCGPGTAWSTASSTCDFAFKVDCSGRSASTVLNPSAHTKTSKTTAHLSGPEHIYEPTQPSSDPFTAVETNPSDLLCPAGVDGLFVHPFDQTKFLNCKAGKVAVQSCQPGYVFSISRGYCQLKSQLVYSDYVTYITSEISYEYSMILSACPGGTDGLHLYPYDAGKYVRCSASKMTILACEQQMAFSLSQKACRPRSQLNSEDRVKFLEELQVQTTYSYQDSQTLQSPLRSCPRNLQGNYPYPFHAGHFVKCQNGLLQVEGCPSGFVFSLSQRVCAARHLLSAHDFLDYVYLSGQFLTDFMQDLTMITCPPRSQGYYLHPFDCTKYVICWDQQTAIESCKQGEVFSISQQICVARDKVTASYDRVEYLGETQHELSEEAESEQPLPGRGFPHDGGYQPQHSGLPLDGRYQPQRYVPVFGGGNQPSLGSIIPQAAGYPPQAQPTGPAFDGGYQQSQGRGFPQEGGYQPAPAALMCPPRVTGLFPNPFDAMGYLHCMEGHTLTRRCSTTDVFSISRGFCVPHQQVASGDRIPYNQQRSVEEDAFVRCPTGASGNFVYPFDCAKFLSCGPNGMILTSCPADQYFSVRRGLCQPKEQVMREDRLYTNSELLIIYEWTQQMKAEGVKTVCPVGVSGSLPHPRISSKFIRCQPGLAEIYDCPSGQIFSISRRLCGPDAEMPSHDRCDYIVGGEGEASYGWRDQLNDNRQSKSYETAGQDQWGNRYVARTTTTVVGDGDRWRDMNMQRPPGIGFQHSPQYHANPSQGWSGQGSSYDHRSPTQSVLYVEGSLQLNHAGETARTEQTIDPTTYQSPTDFHRSTRRAEIETTTINWHASGHSRDFHRRHPNLLDPLSLQKHNHPPPNSHHHNPHRHHEHSPDFHRRHPEMPNPFPKKETLPEWELPEHQQPEKETDWKLMTNPNAESVTSRIDVRSFFNETCEFDCQNGICVPQDSVCDGFNHCGNRLDESNCNHLGYEVRLTGGEMPHMGRISVKINGQWGYVCDDKFGLRDADVVCRELGYKLGAQEVRGSSFYAPADQNFNYAMDEVECQGNETMLKDCHFKGWGVHNCGVDEVAGVACKVPMMKCPNNYWLCQTSKECIPPAFVCDHTADCADKSDESPTVCQAPVEFRLEGGRSSNEGRLEVKYHGVWGSVCDDDFNLKSAQVACNSLGYYGPAKLENNIFGHGNGPIWLDQVMCFGNESSIDKCSHWNWGDHNCNHTEDVALHCSAGPPPRSASRLKALKQGESGKSAALSYSDIGLWERSSRAMRSPRRCGIFKDDLSDEYAHSGERVVKGKTARRGRHPWQATIRTRGRGGISSHWCGAVVISKRHLLTAAHCLYGNAKDAYFVRVGDHYANIAESSEVDTFIEKWYTHEKFRDGTHMNNDIAVVVLKRPLKFSDYVQPICLPDKNVVFQGNRNCTISGWGSIKSGVSTPSQVLRSAELPILPDETCKQSKVYGSAMSEGMFCAGSMDESVDACEGDSGGPLVCSDDDGETLYGLISWGQHCGYINRPGVYVRVNHYIDWIYEKINESLLRF